MDEKTQWYSVDSRSELDRRRDYCALGCTLDGERAKISGSANDHASVWAINDTSRVIPFAWATVYRIMDEFGGHFKS